MSKNNIKQNIPDVPENIKWMLSEDNFNKLVAWGSTDEAQHMFDVLSTMFIYQQRMPVDAEKSAAYGGVAQYLLACEAEGNVIRFLKSLKAMKEDIAKKQQAKQESVNG